MSVQWDTSTTRRLAVVVPLALVFTVLGLGTIPPEDQPTELWPTLGITVIWMAMVWDGRSRLGARHGAHLLAQLALFWLVALGFGWPAGEALWTGLVNVALGLGMLVAYSRLTEAGDWAPRTARANLALLGLAAGTGLVAALLGGLPNLDPGQVDRLTLWWLVRTTVYGYVGPVAFLGLYFGGPRWVDDRVPRWVVALLFPLGALCLWVTYLDPALPLTWFLLLPAVAAGSLLTVRGAAFYSVYVAFLAALATLLPINQYGYSGFLPGSLIIDMLITGSTFITLHLAILRDQTARAMADLERERTSAQDQAELLRTVFESMSDGLVVLHDHRVVLHNAAARLIMGKRVPVGVPVDWVSYFGLRDGDGSPLGPESLSPAPDGTFTRQLSLETEAGTRVLDVGARPLHGSPDRIVVLFSDVTTQRERLSELTSFAGVVAHDLRSPLTHLHGWLELAEDALAVPDPARAAEHVARARASSQGMRQVIDDWLSYTVHREGLLAPTDLPLRPLVSDVVAPFADGRADLAPVFDVDVDDTVTADPALTRQLFANLVSNAVKYAPPDTRPQVTIRSSADEEPGFVRVTVADRGIGLPEGQEQLVFEEFHRAPGHAEVYSGTGLGLSLCRKIVARHGGTIEARNDPDAGTVFSFTLPGA